MTEATAKRVGEDLEKALLSFFHLRYLFLFICHQWVLHWLVNTVTVHSDQNCSEWTVLAAYIDFFL